MNREAMTRLVSARAQGMSRDDIAALYENLKGQIESAAEDWRADRVSCADGSVAFVGQMHVLVIHANGIYRGHLGALLPYHGGMMTPSGFVFPPPNLDAATVQVA